VADQPWAFLAPAWHRLCWLGRSQRLCHTGDGNGGSPTEFDTLAVRSSAKPVCGIVYDPLDVAAVLEIKFSGDYSQNIDDHELVIV
jgi:hypothetical protein